MGRGGAVRTAVAVVLLQDLIDSLIEHVRKVGMKRGAYFGAYEMIDRTHAAFAPGLAACYDVIQVLLKLNPAAEFKPTFLVKAWLACCKLFAGLNSTGLPDELWAGRRADICGTMLCHLRRVKADGVRRNQLSHKATESDMSMVQDLIDMMDDGEKTSSASREPSPAETVLYTTRKLKVQVSLDEDGFPKMLADSEPAVKNSSSPRAEDVKALSAMVSSPFFAELQAMSLASQAGKVRLAASTAQDDSEAEQTDAAIQPDVPPKRKLSASAQQTSLPKRRVSVASASTADPPASPEPAAHANGPVQPKSGQSSMGRVSLVLASKQTYITADKKLVVAISESMSTEHGKIGTFIFNQILLGKINKKEAALACRTTLLA